MAILESAGSANLKAGKREIEMEERRRERRITKLNTIRTSKYKNNKPGMCFENTARQPATGPPRPKASKKHHTDSGR